VTAPRPLVVERSQKTLVIERGGQRPFVVERGASRNVVIERTGLPGKKGEAGGPQPQFSWSPASALSDWMIPHNLGRHPGVSVLLPDGEVILANVQHLDSDVLTVSFSQPTLGTAFLH
jgi:hypothetical protein